MRLYNVNDGMKEKVTQFEEITPKEIKELIYNKVYSIKVVEDIDEYSPYLLESDRVAYIDDNNNNIRSLCICNNKTPIELVNYMNSIYNGYLVDFFSL